MSELMELEWGDTIHRFRKGGHSENWAIGKHPDFNAIITVHKMSDVVSNVIKQNDLDTDYFTLEYDDKNAKQIMDNQYRDRGYYYIKKG